MLQNERRGWWASMPPVTKNLIIINLLIWLAETIVPSFGNRLVDLLGLHYFGSSKFNPVQLLTYLFLHAPTNPTHVFFNMFSLWMFGRLLETVWGSRRFLVYYFICGVGAALVQEGVWALTWMHDYVAGIAPLNGLTYDNMHDIVRQSLAAGDLQFIEATEAYKSMFVTIGASGAIYGILLGFAFAFPNLPLYMFFIPIPIKAKYAVLVFGVLEFIFGATGSLSSIAHFAHLGGMIFGLIILLIWKKQGKLSSGTYY